MAGGRRTDEQARQTRADILRRAVDLVSVEGFEGLTIAAVARDLGMSKAGVLGHFGTKEQLQLEALGEAMATHRRLVVEPARDEARGLERLRGACDRWVEFITAPPWPGGCILIGASFELDDQDSPLAEELRAGMIRWRDWLRREAARAIDAGDLPPRPDAEQLAFELLALAAGTTQSARLHRDPLAAQRLRAAYAGRLQPVMQVNPIVAPA